MIYRTVTFAAIALLGGHIGFNMADRDIPVNVADMQIEPVDPKAGDVAYRRLAFDRKRNCTTHVDQMIYAGHGGIQRFVLPPLEFAKGILPLGTDIAMVPFTVPRNAPPGPAMHRSVNCYACNWTHRVVPLCAAPRDIKFTIQPE
jgi:hypothetical protein